MIEVTDDAAAKLTEILEEEKATDSALRVVVVPSGQGVQYMLTLEDDPTDEDVITETGGLRLLFDSQNADFMEGVKIDYIEETPDLKEVTTDEEEFRNWEGIEEDWQEFNRKNNLENDGKRK